MKKKIVPLAFIICFSIILWASVALSGEYITTIKVPISLVDLPKNYTKGVISHDEVYVKLKSKGWELAKISFGGEEEFLVSAHRKIGKHKVNLFDELKINSWISSTNQVVEIAPSVIEFEVDRIISKKVVVKPNIKIEFKEEFGIASDIQIKPNQIIISGSESIINKIDTIYTQILELKDVTEPVNVELDFVKLDNVKLEQTSCEITFDVQKIVDKSFDDIEIELRNVPSSKELILYPGKINVVLKGGINLLGKLPKDSIKAYIDFWKVLRNENDEIEPEVKIPANTTLVEIRPKKLEYIIKQY